ncbi:MAG: DUF1499 domain-containing protein [Myxococcota bacterium]
MGSVVLFAILSIGCASAGGNSAPYVAKCPATPNCVSTADGPEDPVHHAEPLRFEGDVGAAKARMKDIVLAMPRTALVAESDTGLRFTSTSRVFRFVDDVDIVFVPETGTVAYRSASRVGRGDMGVNRKRMEAVAAAWTSR